MFLFYIKQMETQNGAIFVHAGRARRRKVGFEVLSSISEPLCNTAPPKTQGTALRISGKVQHTGAQTLGATCKATIPLRAGFTGV